MEEDNNNPPPNLTAVVIITLPPPENPSLGKTITAYTISDDRHHHQPPSPPPPPPPPYFPEIADRHQILSPSFSERLLISSRRSVVPVVGVFVLVLYLCAYVTQQSGFVLRDRRGGEEEERGRRRRNESEQHTFVLPLYRKGYYGYESGGVELKLGRFVGDISRRSEIRALKLKIDNTRVLPVRGNVYPDGLYYTYMNLGNPPKPYFLDVDTGSDLTWIQCDAPCTSCAKGAHPFYKPLKTNIILPGDSHCIEVQGNQKTNQCDSCHQCDYEIEYADHSSSMGVLARDELHLNIANGSFINSKFVFGCAYDQQGLLLNTLGKTDGILGLSRAKISLPSQLANQGIIKNVIGHCISADATGGGYMFLGDDFVPYQQMAWVPMVRSSSLNSYQAKMVKMNYGSRQLRLSNTANGQGSLVFDSGSSYSYFTEEAYNDLVAILNDVSSESLVRDMSDTSFPICWRAKSPLRSVKDVRQWFKPLNLQFGSKWWIVSTRLQIPPEGYLVTNSKGNVCLGIFNGKQVHDGSAFILGDISLRGQLFVYDNVHERIGWVQSDCSMPLTFESRPL